MLEATASRACALPGLNRACIEQLARTRVAIIGNGALCAALYPHLAMLGIALTFVDDDAIAPENLANQVFPAAALGEPKACVRARQARALNPDCRAEGTSARLESLGIGELIDADLLVSALDNRSARVRLAEISTSFGIPMLDLATDGSGLRLFGSVSFYGATATSPCYACAFDPATLSRSITEEHATGCPSWRSPNRVVTEPTLQLTSFAAVVGAVAAQWAVAGLLGDGARFDGRRLFISMREGEPTARSATLARRAACALGHTRFDRLVTSPETTVGGTFAYASMLLAAPITAIRFHGRLVVNDLFCPSCRTSVKLVRVSTAVDAAEARCQSCGIERLPLGSLGAFDAEAAHASASSTWDALGFPRHDVVTASSDDGREVHLFVNAGPRARPLALDATAATRG
jgi:molybdopterin/thiamine biosynthesis adenylyltransferase